MKIELVTRIEEISGLSRRWDELACNDPRDGFFRTSGWYRAWIEHIRPDAQPFVIVVRDPAGEIVGLAPLCRLHYRDLGFRLHALTWGGRDVVSADFLDLLSEIGLRPQVMRAVFRFLWETRSEWSLLHLSELVEGGDTESALESMGEEHGLPLHHQEARLCPYIALPHSFDEYLGTLGSSTRYHIRRRIRDVVGKQGARVEICSQPEEMVNGLDTMIRLHLARWRKEHLPGTLGRPGFSAFLRQVCLAPPTGSQARLYLLTHQGEAAAALLAFHFRETALYYQAGWNPDSAIASLSPAVVLMAHSIRDSIERGLRYYEFLRGDEAYKSHWTTTYRKTNTVLLARSLMAKEYLRVVDLKDRCKQLLVSSGSAKAANEGKQEVRADK